MFPAVKNALTFYLLCYLTRAVLSIVHIEELYLMAVKKKASAKKKTTTAKVAMKPTTKSETLNYISEETDLTRKDVNAVFDALAKLMKRELKGRGRPGFYTVPGLMKVKVVRKPATRARKGTNPFTGEEMMFKAKPARNVVKVLPLKGLKEMV